MAKIAVNFDTMDKSIEVKIDGKTIDNITSVNFCSDYGGDEFNCCVTTMTDDEGSDIKSYTTLMASEKEPEFKEVKDFSKTKADIASFFSQE